MGLHRVPSAIMKIANIRVVEVGYLFRGHVVVVVISSGSEIGVCGFSLLRIIVLQTHFVN